MTLRPRLVVLLVSTPLVAFAIVGGLLGKTVTHEDSYQHLRVFEDVVSLVMNNYVEEVEVDRVMEGAMRGLADSLDADTSYLVPAEVKLVDGKVPPEPGDVGLELTRQYYLRVIAARDGTPAARAGLRTGDYVRAIDGDPTRHMSVFEGMRRLRGAVGSKVTLTVLRGSATEPHDVELVREPATGETVTARRLAAPGVGLLRIATFGGQVRDAIRTRVDELRRDGTERLIVDLRATAQGPIENGLAAARLFVPSGVLAKREGRDRETVSLSAEPGDGTIGLPVVILVSAGTSGPAELFAAALRDNGRAELVGEPTIGRAGVQKLIRFPDGSGLLMTAERYLTSGGKPIHGVGLDPDERVEEPDVEFGEPAPTEDPLLDKALERLTARRAA